MLGSPTEPNQAECPDLELIAAFVDGTLGEPERSRTAAHVAQCGRCYFLFSETARVRRQKRKLDVLPFLNRKMAYPAAAALLSAAATLFLVVPTTRPTFPLGAPTPELSELVAAVGTQRTVEPRLTGGFEYGPMRGPVRGEESGGDSLSPDIRIAIARIEKLAVEQRQETLGSLGIAYLIVGDSARAVPALEEIADQAQAPRVLSDLSAAYLVRADARRQSQDYAKALTVADRALKADSRLAEAFFNRALAVERLFLTSQAIQAWQDYLKVDSTSGWAREAERHLRALADSSSQTILEDRNRVEAAARQNSLHVIEEAVRKWPHVTREWVEDQVMFVWPKLVMEGGLAEARALLARVVPVTEAIAKEYADPFMLDAVRVALAASDDETHARSLADAHQKYLSAWTDYQEDRIRQSDVMFRNVLPALDRASSPFATSARFYRAVASYYAPNFPQALGEFEHVAEVAARQRYTRLRGFVHRMNGLIQVVQGKFGGALDEYRAGLQCFEATGDWENVAGIHTALAESLEFIGEREAAWTERITGLSRLNFVHDPRRRHTIFQEAAAASLRQELPESALYFQDAALKNAYTWKRPAALVNVLLNRAEIYEQLGNPQLAEADLDEAEKTLEQIPDAGLVARHEARILFARGEAASERHPIQALGWLDSALAHFKRGGANWPLAQLHLAHGRAQLAAGQPDRAEADFLAGITVFEEMRALITSEALRSSYFEQPWDLFTEMIRLQVDRRKRPDRALSFAEQARARTLLEAVGPASVTQPVDPAAVRQALPEGVAILFYASLDDRLLIWALTRSRLQFVDTQLGRERLGWLVNQYRGETATTTRSSPSLIALYDALIRPIAHALQAGTRLAVVPDGFLHAVPFAALLRREDARFLVEDHAVQVTPSLTVFQKSNDARSKDSDSAARTALIVGNPRARSGLGTGANLPAAESEARDIATMYRNAEVLIGSDATKTRLLAAAGRHEIVHFAGHAIPNEEYPALSRLLLSGDARDSDVLYAHEIGAHHFDRTQLVVLAACQTNAGRIRRGEGVFSLARPFIAAGVPAVIASLTDVDDHASHRLFVTFHRALQNGQSATDALRSAQLAALAEPDPFLQNPANWGSFVVIGGISAIQSQFGAGSTMAVVDTSKAKD